ARREGRAEHGVGLVDRPVGLHPGIVLGHAAVAEQARRAVIPRPRIDFHVRLPSPGRIPRRADHYTGPRRKAEITGGFLGARGTIPDTFAPWKAGGRSDRPLPAGAPSLSDRPSTILSSAAHFSTRFAMSFVVPRWLARVLPLAGLCLIAAQAHAG